MKCQSIIKVVYPFFTKIKICNSIYVKSLSNHHVRRAHGTKFSHYGTESRHIELAQNII